MESITIMPAPSFISPEEYLIQERDAFEKHEYYEGKVTALSGASMAHNHIVANLIRTIGNFLKDRPCVVLPSDMRVCTPSEKTFMYPDATIVCDPPEMADDRFDTLKNPKVIFEVLSPSTKKHDRGKKFSFYQQIPSFREYILIDTTEVFVEFSHKQEDGSWNSDATADPSEYLCIDSIGCSIPLREIYRNVF